MMQILRKKKQIWQEIFFKIELRGVHKVLFLQVWVLDFVLFLVVSLVLTLVLGL